MKAFLLLSALFFASCFEATIGQKEDHDIRLENFLNNSLAAFPNWLKQNGLVPEPLPGTGNFTLQSDSKEYGPYFDISGKIWNRSYHGYEQNVEALDINANLSASVFQMLLTYGDEDSRIEGEYSLDGKMWGSYPIHGAGRMYRTNLRRRMDDWALCFLEVTDEGYFQIVGSMTTISPAPFQTFTLEGLDDGTERRTGNIIPPIEGWHKGQHEFEGPSISSYWVDYMKELFAVTPIADIVGHKFSLKLAPSSKEFRKMSNNSKIPFFDKEKKEWRQKVYHSYKNN